MPVPDFGRAREGPSLFRPLKRGDGRAEQARKKKKPAPVGAPATSFRFRVSRCPDPSRPDSSRRGCSGVRPGVQLRTTPAGAASRPAITTPHESAPQRTGHRSIIGILRVSRNFYRTSGARSRLRAPSQPLMLGEAYRPRPAVPMSIGPKRSTLGAGVRFEQK